MSTYTPPAHRLYRKVQTCGDCRVWTGAVNSDGYGVIRVSTHTLALTHRVAYAHAGNTLTPGMVIDHTCRTRLCVRVDHLELVTIGENTGRGLWAGYWQEYRQERQRQEDALSALCLAYKTERQDLLDRGIVKLINLTDYLTNMRGSAMEATI